MSVVTMKMRNWRVCKEVQVKETEYIKGLAM